MLLNFVSAALGLACLAPTVHAHGGVLQYRIMGQLYDSWHPYNTPVGQTSIQRPWATYDPITNPLSSTVACNDDGNSGALQLTARVEAGQPITAYWNQVWPHPQGPMLTYLAKCPGSTCDNVNASGLKWFKIDHAGLISGTIGSGTWASGQMIANNCTWTSTIPKTVPSGNYLIRFETIALHSLPAQLYPECAQIEIYNGGSREPLASELVSFPGGYSPNDPGLVVNLYSQPSQTETRYVIPGPPLYGTGDEGGPPTTPDPTTTEPTTPPSEPTGTVPQWGQCGGIGYNGPTGCISPYVCTKLNDFYYQCL